MWRKKLDSKLILNRTHFILNYTCNILSAIRFCYVCILLKDIFEQKILSRISKNIKNRKEYIYFYDMSWFQFQMDLTIIFNVASITKIVWTVETHLTKMWHKITADFLNENILKWGSYVKNQTMKRFKFETIFHSSYGKDV